MIQHRVFMSSFIHFSTKDDMVKTPPFSRFRNSFPALLENQGSTYIEIVSPTVFIQESQWLLWIKRNWGGVQIVSIFFSLQIENLICEFIYAPKPTKANASSQLCCPVTNHICFREIHCDCYTIKSCSSRHGSRCKKTT